jgi:hypothetical protein
MVSLQRKLDQQSMGEQERQFFSQGLTYLTTCSGQHIEAEDWMITDYEVEFMEKIGSGGLYVALISCTIYIGQLSQLVRSGLVFKGTWSKIEVALKILKTDAGVLPSSEVRLLTT